jgi:hypothetical protein
MQLKVGMAPLNKDDNSKEHFDVVIRSRRHLINSIDDNVRMFSSSSPRTTKLIKNSHFIGWHRVADNFPNRNVTAPTKLTYQTLRFFSLFLCLQTRR